MTIDLGFPLGLAIVIIPSVVIWYIIDPLNKRQKLTEVES